MQRLIVAIEETPHKLCWSEDYMLVLVKPLALKHASLGVTIRLDILDKQALNLFLPRVVPLDHKHAIEYKDMYNRGAVYLCW